MQRNKQRGDKGCWPWKDGGAGKVIKNIYVWQNSSRRLSLFCSVLYYHVLSCSILSHLPSNPICLAPFLSGTYNLLRLTTWPLEDQPVESQSPKRFTNTNNTAANSMETCCFVYDTELLNTTHLIYKQILTKKICATLSYK